MVKLQIFLEFSPLFGEDEPILIHIFQMGGKNHRPVKGVSLITFEAPSTPRLEVGSTVTIYSRHLKALKRHFWTPDGKGKEWNKVGPYLEDHPRTCKWLITMVIVFVP